MIVFRHRISTFDIMQSWRTLSFEYGGSSIDDWTLSVYTMRIAGTGCVNCCCLCGYCLVLCNDETWDSNDTLFLRLEYVGLMLSCNNVGIVGMLRLVDCDMQLWDCVEDVELVGLQVLFGRYDSVSDTFDTEFVDPWWPCCMLCWYHSSIGADTHAMTNNRVGNAMVIATTMQGTNNSATRTIVVIESIRIVVSFPYTGIYIVTTIFNSSHE